MVNDNLGGEKAIIEERRKKLEQLREKGDAYSNSFKPKNNSSYKILNIKNLEKITNIFFGSKRKMVNKAFAKIFNEYKLVAKKLKINLSARPSELSFEDYYRLVEYYEKLK